MYYYENITRRVLNVKGITFKPGVVTESPEYVGFPGLAQVPKPISKPSDEKKSKVDAPSSNEIDDSTKGGKPDGSNNNK